jgi:hypothetical protein
MTIDKSGKWWKGADFHDLAEYIRLLTTEGYPAEEVIQSICVCGNTTFQLLADQGEGCAQRVCSACNRGTFICDSADYWAKATPQTVRCPCGQTTFEIGVGFSFREQNEVTWITVGQRCVRCGVLASYVDWKVNYGPSGHLLDMA